MIRVSFGGWGGEGTGEALKNISPPTFNIYMVWFSYYLCAPLLFLVRLSLPPLDHVSKRNTDGTLTIPMRICKSGLEFTNTEGIRKSSLT